MNKKIFLPIFLALAILTVGVLASKVKAEESNSYPPIVQKIAERFNLNINEVEDVFDEERDIRRAEMFAHFAERLNDLVAEGKITESQKESILDKHEEMHNQIESFNELSPSERKEKMMEIHSEFKNFLENEGIDESLIGPFKLKFGHRLMNRENNDTFIYKLND